MVSSWLRYEYDDGVATLDCCGNATHYEMDAFGRAVLGSTPWEPMSSIGPKEHLTGKMYDEVTGLYYFHARWYDPEVGRFCSPDPLERSRRVYDFSDCLPTERVDPTGLCTYLAQRKIVSEKVAYHCVYEEEDEGSNQWWTSELHPDEWRITETNHRWRHGRLDRDSGVLPWSPSLGYAKRTDITSYCEVRCLRDGKDSLAFDDWKTRPVALQFPDEYDPVRHNSNHFMQDLLTRCCKGILVNWKGVLLLP